MAQLKTRVHNLILCSLACLSLQACAADAKTPAKSPVTFHHEVKSDPNMVEFVVTVDLADPRVSLRVSPGGPHPDGPGKWLTTLLPVPEVADRDGYDIAVNGDFFGAQATKDIEGKNTGYIRGKWAAPIGPAITDGQLWAPAATTRPALLVDDHEHVSIAPVDPKQPMTPDIRQAVGGNLILIKDGKRILSKNEKRAPRTVVGLNKDNSKLILLIVDGYHPDYSAGMTYNESSDEMLKLGAYTAINLDGGGSTTLVMRDGNTHKLRVINKVSDGKPRSVADVLGITVKGGVGPLDASSN